MGEEKRRTTFSVLFYIKKQKLQYIKISDEYTSSIPALSSFIYLQNNSIIFILILSQKQITFVTMTIVCANIRIE